MASGWNLWVWLVSVVRRNNYYRYGHHSLIPCFPSTARLLANLPHGMLLLVITVMIIIKI